MDVPLSAVRTIIEQALAEDVGWGDITTRALVPPDHKGRAQALMKSDGILCGGEVFAMAFTVWDPSLQVDLLARDGAQVSRGDIVARVAGSAASILTAERVALNLLQRLSGIATMTRRFVQEVGELPTRVIETRKTTPGLRLLEKYAVRVGGGSNHRFNLSDGVLIKDNHLAVMRTHGGDLAEAIDLAKRSVPLTIKVEVEVTTVAEARAAAQAGADLILLDNMSIEDMRESVKVIRAESPGERGRILVEASGGITLETVKAIAGTGVDYVSSGALTHSFRALDISLEMAVGLSA
ncbi:MAG: carboxylating nicotinate-nucleotide diphosphorylase [Dehalococcoidia bacterium]|nr:carboxylating nicotinate-nucleotide diphosphorylase [Dehalococcoidia bacterium]